MSIQEFFRGRNVFITGATGFMGKVLIEKLVRSCPDIGKICILIRQKRGKDIDTRVKEMLNVEVHISISIIIILSQNAYHIYKYIYCLC